MCQLGSTICLTALDTRHLHRLRERAAASPVDALEVLEATKTPDGMARHREMMAGLSVAIPGPCRRAYIVSFYIENGHNSGPCRHMSMSIVRHGDIPSFDSVMIVAQELGFVGGAIACSLWIESVADGIDAINLIQPVSVVAGGSA
jgi:hypothetical protein